MAKLIARVVAVLVVALLLLIFFTRPSPCDDAVRGLRNEITIGFRLVTEKLDRIETGLVAEQVREFREDLQLDALQAQAMNSCEQACRFLNECRRWRFWLSPAEACPREFEVWNSRTDSTLALLERLRTAEQALVRDVLPAAQGVEEAEAALQEQAQAPGSSPIALNDAKIALQNANEEFQAALKAFEALLPAEVET